MGDLSESNLRHRMSEAKARGKSGGDCRIMIRKTRLSGLWKINTWTVQTGWTHGPREWAWVAH